MLLYKKEKFLLNTLNKKAAELPPLFPNIINQ
jgi:hypothetical protein